MFLAAGVIYFPGVLMRTSVRERCFGFFPWPGGRLARRGIFLILMLLQVICPGEGGGFSVSESADS
ncbi:MAG TPA: hypothetical protein DD422_00940 [Akkermansia sp.]|nr:hypothetical protein [Akkermansia sp.]HBN16597.1 hypothetical protein [Akkermansia sp.]